MRCRETFQREILKLRHDILTFLARRGFVYRAGTNWCTPHLRWLEHLTSEQSPLAPADRLVFREYHALLAYKLQRRDELDREIERFALTPLLAPAMARLQCFRGVSLHAAMVLATAIVDWRRFERPGQFRYHDVASGTCSIVANEENGWDVEETEDAPGYQGEIQGPRNSRRCLIEVRAVTVTIERRPPHGE